MAHHAANGWIVPLPEELGFSVPVHRRTGIIEGRERDPSGLFIHCIPMRLFKLRWRRRLLLGV